MLSVPISFHNITVFTMPLMAAGLLITTLVIYCCRKQCSSGNYTITRDVTMYKYHVDVRVGIIPGENNNQMATAGYTNLENKDVL